MTRNSITWDNYVSLAVNNTSVNVGRPNFVKAEARKKSKNMLFIKIKSFFVEFCELCDK